MKRVLRIFIDKATGNAYLTSDGQRSFLVPNVSTDKEIDHLAFMGMGQGLDEVEVYDMVLRKRYPFDVRP